MYQDEINGQELETARLKRNVALIAALGLVPMKDGNQWSFLYGSNLMEGIAGFGDTVYEAAANFEAAYCQETIPVRKK